MPVRTVASADPTTPPEAPSWGRVLATTLGLWASRRLLRPRGLRRPWQVLLLVICALVVGGTAVGVVRLTGTSSRAARVSSSARPYQGHPGGSAGPAGVAASVRSQAAAWIAGQVSSDDTIGCDPLMCAALSAHGVPAGRLLPLGAAASSAPGAEVIAVSPAPRTGFSQDRAGVAGQLRVRRQPDRGPRHVAGRGGHLPGGPGGRRRRRRPAPFCRPAVITRGRCDPGTGQALRRTAPGGTGWPPRLPWCARSMASTSPPRSPRSGWLTASRDCASTSPRRARWGC